MKRKLLPLLIVLGGIGLGATRASALLIEFNTSALTVSEGSTFTVDLRADIGAEGLLGWDLSLDNGDPSLVSIDSWTLGALWDDVPGSIVPDGLAGVSLDPVSGDDVLLATLELSCLGVGASDLGVVLTDQDFQGFLLGDGSLLQDIGLPRLTITQKRAVVPEPGTVLLLGTGLAGLVGWRRRGRRDG